MIPGQAKSHDRCVSISTSTRDLASTQENNPTTMFRKINIPEHFFPSSCATGNRTPTQCQANMKRKKEEKRFVVNPGQERRRAVPCTCSGTFLTQSEYPLDPLSRNESGTIVRCGCLGLVPFCKINNIVDGSLISSLKKNHIFVFFLSNDHSDSVFCIHNWLWLKL
jgi:hypothetical protein